MSTAKCGYRAIDGSIWSMEPDCKRRNADIYAGRVPANLERGVTRITRPIEDEIIAADIASGTPIERGGLREWVGFCICGAVGAALGVIPVYVIDYFWRAN